MSIRKVSATLRVGKGCIKSENDRGSVKSAYREHMETREQTNVLNSGKLDHKSLLFGTTLAIFLRRPECRGRAFAKALIQSVAVLMVQWRDDDRLNAPYSFPSSAKPLHRQNTAGQKAAKWSNGGRVEICASKYYLVLDWAVSHKPFSFRLL